MLTASLLILYHHLDFQRRVLQAFEKINETPAKDSDFMEPFKNVSEELREEARSAVEEHVIPGFNRIQDCLKTTYMAALRPTIWRRSKGADLGTARLTAVERQPYSW